MTFFQVARIIAVINLTISPLALRAQQLEVIIVTAQKRTESLQTVPISVAVISGVELANRNKNQIAELTRFVPGFTFAENTVDAGRNLLVRGVGTAGDSRSVDLSVGTAVDNVVSSNLLDFSDVERVELLRGPQGMLFGKNASAGLLNIYSRRPTEELSTGFGASYGSEDLVNLNAYLSGPIVDDELLGRLSLYSNTADPMLENEYPGGDDFNNRDEWGGRGKLRWMLTDDLDAQLNYTHAERNHICCMAALRAIIPGSIVDQLGGPVGPKNDIVKDNDTSKGETKVDIYSLEANYILDDYLLTSISSYTNENGSVAARADGYTRTALPVNDGNDGYEQTTQELRFTSPADRTLAYVAGLYYFEKQFDQHFVRYIDLYGIGAAQAPDSGAYSTQNDVFVTSESMAVFGQLTWNVTESSRLSVGARYNDDEISQDQTVSSLPGTFPEAPPGSINAQTSDQAVSWRVIGEHDIVQDALAYASIARGYKGPGSNSLPSGPTSGDLFVDPEIPTSYEAGIKSQWLDNRLRINGTAYYTQFKDFQAYAQTAGAFPPIFYLTNAGELETQGIELEVDAQIVDNLSFQGSLAYTDAIFAEWRDAPCYVGQSAAQGCINDAQDLSGADMPNSPDWAIYLSPTYYIPISDKPFDGFVTASYFWRDAVQFDSANNPLLTGDAYDTFDLYTGISARNGRYRLQFYVLNLFDEFYPSAIGGQEVVGIRTAQLLDYTYTRRFGVSLQMDW